MDIKRLEQLILQISNQELTVEDAMARLKDLPYEDIGHTCVDHHRPLRTGLPETVFCEGKTPEQVAEIMTRLAERNRTVLGTRASHEVFSAVKATHHGAIYHEIPRLIVLEGEESETQTMPEGRIAVVSAGTSDMPVAEEAAICAETFGSIVDRVYDVGVAGIHRLFGSLTKLRESKVVVVVAGMDGALPSVVAGLMDKPVLAVPTSVGYGASFKGVAALLTMLNTCAPGIAVLNIDNGYGAAVMAHMINVNSR